MRRALGASLVVLVCAGAGIAARGDVPLTKLPAPPWHRSGPTGASTKTRLTLVSSSPNAITDTRRWFARNGLVLAADRVPGSSHRRRPAAHASARHTDLVPGRPADPLPPAAGGALLVYGSDFASGRYLLARRGGSTRYALDFSNYAYAPRPVPADRPYVYTEPDLGQRGGRGVYVSHAHTTFARSSRGLNEQYVKRNQ